MPILIGMPGVPVFFGYVKTYPAPEIDRLLECIIALEHCVRVFGLEEMVFGMGILFCLFESSL